jgi:hypothetical protein
MQAFEEMTDENIQKYKLRYVLGKIYQYVEYKAFKKSSDLVARRVRKGRMGDAASARGTR